MVKTTNQIYIYKVPPICRFLLHGLMATEMMPAMWVWFRQLRITWNCAEFGLFDHFKTDRLMGVNWKIVWKILHLTRKKYYKHPVML